MVNYIIIHNTHNGCYDFQCYQDEVARIRLTSITINPPKIFLFNTRDEAQEFFEEYINDVDCIDIKCKKGDEVEHIDYCTCGVIELDDRGEPVLFYNKKNQIFLLEHGPQVFIPNQELKNDIRNLNLTNRLIRKCKSLGREQRNRYIELGKYCEECNVNDENEGSDDESEQNKKLEDNIVIKENIEISPPKPSSITSLDEKIENNPSVNVNETKKKTTAKKNPKNEDKKDETTEKKKRTYTKKIKDTDKSTN
jgi:hypothetical protein